MELLRFGAALGMAGKIVRNDIMALPETGQV
jgi:hypothetical protein